MTVYIQKGWQHSYSMLIAQLYEEAFGAKFQCAVTDKNQRIELLSNSFVPDYSFAAFSNNVPVGLAGFNVESGSLTGGIGAKGLIKQLGLMRGVWACVVFSLFERQPDEQELVMDGIAVDCQFRGQGIGSMLLDHIISYAGENGFTSVRLDVIDSNDRARRLYESKGFVAVKTESYPYLKWLLGFSGATTMKLTLG